MNRIDVARVTPLQRLEFRRLALRLRGHGGCAALLLPLVWCLRGLAGIRASDAWRLAQGVAASVFVAGTLYAVSIPYGYRSCEICRASLPSYLWWMCALECWMFD